MVYDTLNNVGRYAPLFHRIDELERALFNVNYTSPMLRRVASDGSIEAYTGEMIASEDALCFHYVTAGKEVIAAGYRSDAKRAPLRNGGIRYLSDAPVHTVITLTAGEFILFMPAEPFALALTGSSDDYISETLYLRDESVQE